MQEIAEKAGVSRSTVSRVLSGSSLISKATAARVQAVIKACDYHPDPALKVLSARRFGWARDPALTHLAIIHCRKMPMISQKILEFLVAESERAGFTAETFPLVNYSDAPGTRSLSRSLYTRGIRGAFAVMQPPGRHEWPDFSQFRRMRLVGIGSRVRNFPIHSVLPDRSANLRTALSWLSENGFTRTGLLLSRKSIERKGETLLAAYLSSQFQQKGLKELIPPFIWGDSRESELKAWFENYQPDSLLLGDAFFLGFISPFMRPENIRKAAVLVDSADLYTGINQIVNHWQEIARNGVQEIQKGLLSSEENSFMDTKSLMMVPGKIVSAKDIDDFALQHSRAALPEVPETLPANLAKLFVDQVW